VYAELGEGVLEVPSHGAGRDVEKRGDLGVRFAACDPAQDFQFSRRQGCPAVGHFAIKSQYFHPTSNHEWHYVIFGDKIASAYGCGQNSGVAVINGDDFDISMDTVRHSVTALDRSLPLR
jgi:hypothetical protein